ncbi:aminoglycoside 6'-N-acetyltransferase [Aliiroseovarius halocynthiae]|uniref:GNAT family N-acetyltransferase n=1 Tax=Aliiroseovarius halocynthiae TaxID=985055 RepID=UPI002402F808|nr:GNAT family N-acetyltransferase [Aliiroseovarius halocynthiae]SMR82515.1 aminoglycoside 6'-N-acetyltransferase [Aliiroseovarius halocynthiae]
MQADLTFRPMTPDDMPLLRKWMYLPHWREWWGDDPEEELGFINDMLEGHDPSHPFLFVLNDTPIGYIQYWVIGDHQTEELCKEYPWLTWLSPETVGVDLSIGPADLMSKGLGTRILKDFTTYLRSIGHDDIIIDPDPANIRAVRAYEKAGFAVIPEFKGRTADCLLMRLKKGNTT